MGIMSFDQIAVIAIHRTDQIGKRCHDPFWQTSAKASRPGRQIDSQISELSPETGALRYQQRLHQTHGLFAVEKGACPVRYDVRFHVRINLGYFANYNMVFLVI